MIFFGEKKRPTIRQVRRMKCFRCGAPSSYATWQICSNERRHVPICVKCDIAMNKATLMFMGLPYGRVRKMMARYEKKVAEDSGDDEV